MDVFWEKEDEILHQLDLFADSGYKVGTIIVNRNHFQTDLEGYKRARMENRIYDQYEGPTKARNRVGNEHYPYRVAVENAQAYIDHVK